MCPDSPLDLVTIHIGSWSTSIGESSILAIDTIFRKKNLKWSRNQPHSNLGRLPNVMRENISWSCNQIPFQKTNTHGIPLDTCRIISFGFPLSPFLFFFEKHTFLRTPIRGEKQRGSKAQGGVSVRAALTGARHSSAAIRMFARIFEDFENSPCRFMYHFSDFSRRSLWYTDHCPLSCLSRLCLPSLLHGHPCLGYPTSYL